MPSIASSRVSVTGSKKSVRESIARKVKGKKVPVILSSDDEDDDDDNHSVDGYENSGALLKGTFYKNRTNDTDFILKMNRRSGRG